jgi:glyoxylase-like metal-dependent hydrolase (beta-lactamase superfamily II)
MSRRVTRGICLAVAGLAALATGYATPRTGADLKASYFQARPIVDRAIEAHGGAERLQSLQALRLDYSGHVAAVFQGQNVRSPHLLLPRSGSVMYDVGAGDIDSTVETRWPDFTQRSRVIVKDGRQYSVDETSQTYRASEVDEVVDTWSRRLPPVLFRSLLQDMSSIGYLGRTARDGEDLHVVHAIGPGGQASYLYLAARDYNLHRIEFLSYFPDFGDTLTVLEFSGYRSLGGYLLPSEMRHFENGDLVTEYAFDEVAFNDGARTMTITLPDDYTEATAGSQSTPADVTTREIADGTYLTENLSGQDYNVMFVEFDEYVAVLEAPLDDRASHTVLEQVRKLAPGKPVNYIMSTHFHGDHTGGIRMYMREGARIITTPGSKIFFEDMARRTHTLRADSMPDSDTNPAFALLREGAFLLDDGQRRIRFIDIGPTAHVDEMIVAYLPEQKILFQGDLFRVPAPDAEPEAARDQALELYEYIIDSGLEIDLLVGVHGPIGTVNDLADAVRLRENGE